MCVPGVGGDLGDEDVGCGHGRGVDDVRRHFCGVIVGRSVGRWVDRPIGCVLLIVEKVTVASERGRIGRPAVVEVEFSQLLLEGRRGGQVKFFMGATFANVDTRVRVV